MLRVPETKRTAEPERDTPAFELSVVMPCLNEADTLATCIDKAIEGCREAGVEAEIIVADNGSTDGSIEIAEAKGARVVRVRRRGYGAALIGGINASRGKYVVMGDADDSYDFREIPKFVEGLRGGADLVQGCRLPWGGGTVKPGAMPFLHRWIGNPMFTILVRRLFKAPINDVYCGLRGFTRQLYDDLELRCEGMEFATEMVIKTALFRRETAETPITLHPDGRKAHAPHLRTFRDGWRTLRFFLLYSPRWVYLAPGLFLLLLGALGYGLALPRVAVAGIHFDAHTLLVASLALLIGVQSLQFGVLAKRFAIREGLLPEDKRIPALISWSTVERGIVMGGLAVVLGTGLIAYAWNEWRLSGFGALNYADTMRIVIPGVTLAAMGYQAVIAGFLSTLFSLERR